VTRRSNRLLLLVLTGLAAALIVRLVRQAILARHADFFRGKVVILTGASRGIGRVLAYALAVRGAHLVLAARSADQLRQVADHCEALNLDIEVMALPTDVADEAQLKTLVSQTLERFGRIDILISNAGIMQGGAISTVDMEQIRRHIEVNLIATIRLTQLVLRPMLARGRGHVVIMASAAGRHTVPYFVPYGITKHGLIGFGEGLRRELAGTGLQVLTVNPGFTATDMITALEPAYRRMGIRIMPPEHVARKTLEGIVLGVPEINVGWLETFGQYVSVLMPYFADLFWRLRMPRDFPELAEQQRTE
jgi:hypothetical protein